jgi:EAL domain-containing protein (putative c-di-GMP-specific phosphodiesterase class I)/CheY-like chemotaxis protein
MQKTRVLVADDDDAVVDVLRALLGSQDDLRFIGAAHDTEHAIELSVREQPDVALIDVRMPGGGGVRATREIARRCPRTRVIALTAHEDESTVIAMMAAGANAYVPKGESTERILREIRRPMHLVPRSTDDGVGIWSVDRAPGAHNPWERRRAQRERVREALDDGSVTATYRTIFDVRTGAVAGLAARTRVAKLPMRGGDAWAAEAEAVGLLEEFDIAALLAADRDAGLVPSFAFLMVPVSPATLLAPAYHAAVRALGCGRIVLDVTEHAPVEDHAPINDALASLRAEGVRLAVSDVGAGLSSLRHVAMLAPDLVTIDTALTDGVDQDAARHAVVAAITARSAQLGATTIAQDVTTESQLEELAGLRIDLVHGPVTDQLRPKFLGSQEPFSQGPTHADAL